MQRQVAQVLSWGMALDSALRLWPFFSSSLETVLMAPHGGSSPRCTAVPVWEPLPARMQRPKPPSWGNEASHLSSPSSSAACASTRAECRLWGRVASKSRSPIDAARERGLCLLPCRMEFHVAHLLLESQLRPDKRSVRRPPTKQRKLSATISLSASPQGSCNI
jgi:hypothetical protein